MWDASLPLIQSLHKVLQFQQSRTPGIQAGSHSRGCFSKLSFTLFQNIPLQVRLVGLESRLGTGKFFLNTNLGEKSQTMAKNTHEGLCTWTRAQHKEQRENPTAIALDMDMEAWDCSWNALRWKGQGSSPWDDL